MDKKFYPVTALVLILSVTAAVGYVAPSPAPGTPVRILLENKAGKVIFDHKIHAENYGLDCATCHHQRSLLSPTEIIRCSDCHNDNTAGDKMPGRTDAFHGQCMGCHEQMSGPWGKDACNQCHLK